MQAILANIPKGFVLFLFFFSIYAFTMSAQIQYGDEIEKYKVAQSIIDRGEFSIRRTVMKNDVGTGGLNYSAYELGQTLTQVPLYALGRWVNGFFSLPDVNAMGQLFVGLLNPLVIALICAVFFESCASLNYSQRTSLALTLVLGLATILWPYSKGFTREPLLALFLLLSFYAILRFEKTRRAPWLLVAGIASGLLTFTKLIQVVVIPIFLSYIVALILQDQKNNKSNVRVAAPALLKGVAVFLVPFIVFMGLQSLYALARFGTLYSGIGGTKLDPISWIFFLLPYSQPGAAFIGLVFSPEKSVFLYSPPILLTLTAWFKMLRAQKRLAFFGLALIGASLVTVLARPDWDGGTWWGPRYLVPITPFLILPLGTLQSLSDTARRRWNLACGVLFVIGFLIQSVGALSNARDYLDIVGRGITLAGQIDFLRHGAIDSLAIYLSSFGSPIQINPNGMMLIGMAALLGALIVRGLLRHDAETHGSWRAGFVIAAFVLLVEFTAFVIWVVAPYPQVLAAQANTKFVAGNAFLADGRRCEAIAMYRLAIERGTTYQREAIVRFDELNPRPEGSGISAIDLMAQVEAPDTATVRKDDAVTLSGDGALEAHLPPPLDAIVRVVTNPISVLPNTTYELSGWIRTENVYGTGYGSVSLDEDNGVWENKRETDITSLTETTGWRPFRRTITTLPTTRRLFVAAGLWKTYGTVWIDEVEIAQITKDNPASTETVPCK